MEEITLRLLMIGDRLSEVMKYEMKLCVKNYEVITTIRLAYKINRNNNIIIEVVADGSRSV